MSATIGTIIQCQFLNKLLTSKDKSLLSLNNIDNTFFSDYPTEFEFIKNHISSYDSIPDSSTFLNTFPNFTVLEVNEPDSYLIDALCEDKNKRITATYVNAIRDAVLGNRMSEVPVLTQKLNDALTKSTTLTCSSLVNDTSRYDEYVSKCSDFFGSYVSTGFKELDDVIGGWDRKEELATIVARTNMGKSWIAIQSAVAAAKAGLKVGFYSGEMGKNKVGYRADTIISHLSNSSMTHGNTDIQIDYKEYITNLKNEFKSGGDILILTPNDVGGGPVGVNVLKSFIEKFKLDMLVIDQHSLLDDDNHARDPVTRASNISKDIKLMQVKYKIPIIAVSQQNRTSAENGQDTTMIAQSDRIGQDATIVLFFEQKDGIATLTLGKSRDSSNFKKLRYVWDINHGIWQFLPEEDDATNGQACDELRQEYDYDDTEE